LQVRKDEERALQLRVLELRTLQPHP